MAKLIGIIPLYDEEKQSLWMLPAYVEMIERSGGVPVILPLTTNEGELDVFIGMCGGFLFTGGQDVDPHIYGCERTKACGVSCPERDKMEAYILDECIKKDIPVLGICRGIQFINAHLGGTLYRDLPSEYGKAVNHHMSPPYDRVVHKVKILRNTPLYALLGEEELGVNSYHHQAVKTLSPKLRAFAVSEDGLTEGVYMPGHRFLWAVQWHPELNFSVDPHSRMIVKKFIASV